jgi:hypothetical protein
MKAPPRPLQTQRTHSGESSELSVIVPPPTLAAFDHNVERVGVVSCYLPDGAMDGTVAVVW